MGNFFRNKKCYIRVVVGAILLNSLSINVLANENKGYYLGQLINVALTKEAIDVNTKKALVSIPTTIGNKYQLEEAMLIASDRLSNEFSVYAEGMSNDDLRNYSIIDNQVLSERINGYKIVRPRSSSSEIVITLYYKTMYEASKAYKEPEIYERKISSTAKKALDVAKNVIHTKIKPDMTDFEKEKIIHDYIIENTTYALENMEGRKSTEDIFGVQGVLCNKSAVCQGYAETMKLFMDMLDIECYVVSGKGYTNHQAVEHAWNLVKLEDEWYHVDVTWDDPDKGNQKSYQYFNVSDKVMAKDHVADSNRSYPQANGQKYAYASMNLVNSQEEFSAKMNELLQRGLNEASCYCDFNADLEMLNVLFNKEFKKNNLGGIVQTGIDAKVFSYKIVV